MKSDAYYFRSVWMQLSRAEADRDAAQAAALLLSHAKASQQDEVVSCGDTNVSEVEQLQTKVDRMQTLIKVSFFKHSNSLLSACLAAG